MGLFITQSREIDTLVVGCTHYPFISDHLQAMMGADVMLVKNGEAVALQTQRLLRQSGQHTESHSPRAMLNRPGFELTPRSWTVAIPPIRRCFCFGNLNYLA